MASAFQLSSYYVHLTNLVGIYHLVTTPTYDYYLDTSTELHVHYEFGHLQLDPMADR